MCRHSENTGHREAPKDANRGRITHKSDAEFELRHERATFRVVWVRAMENSSEKQIGAECVEADKNIWGQEFRHQEDEYEEKE